VPKAFEQADVLGLLDVRELQHLVDEHPRRPGTGAIRSVLERASRWRGVTRRELESRFRELVDVSALPAPDTNQPLDLVERRIEGDVVWPEARLIVELDSFAFHHTRRAFERDRERDRLAVAAGWRVMRITWRQLAERPKDVVRDLQRALEAR
jgi:hypothetical protein